MSLYNALFGVNQFAPILLGMLGTSIDQVPRFRDVYVDGDEIVIYTRTGGGNRDHYESGEASPSNADLRRLPGFLRDEDDGFDSTFAHWHYAIPEEYRAAVSRIAEASKDRPKPKEAWVALLNGGLNPVLDQRAKEVAEQIADQMKSGKTIIEI